MFVIGNLSLFAWWRDYIFIWCCYPYSYGSYHSLHLWVVPHVHEGMGWSSYDSIWYAMTIWSSFYLLCCSMMILCERRLHITSPIWAYRAAL
jgi:hypothetical protein